MGKLTAGMNGAGSPDAQPSYDAGTAAHVPPAIASLGHIVRRVGVQGDATELVADQASGGAMTVGRIGRKGRRQILGRDGERPQVPPAELLRRRRVDAYTPMATFRTPSRWFAKRS